MKIKFYYITGLPASELIANTSVSSPKQHEPKVLEKFNRYSFYILCGLRAWFKNLLEVQTALLKLDNLEKHTIELVEFYESDMLAEITLEGVQVSNLTDESVSYQPEGRFTYQEVKTIFLKYKEFLEMPVSLDSTLEFEL